MAESFFSGFTREVVDGEHFATHTEVRKEIFAWLNRYNQERLHSSIGDRSRNIEVFGSAFETRL